VPSCLCCAVSAAVEHFESGVKEVDVKLSVRGGDRGIGAPRQKAEVYSCLRRAFF